MQRPFDVRRLARAVLGRPWMSAAGALALLCAGALPAGAEEAWPSRAVRVIYPYGPGSGDLLVRPYLERLSQAFGEQFVIEYKAGAGGSIGAEAAAKSAPDGYTLFATSSPVITMIPQLRKVNYDWDRDFVPVGRFGRQISGTFVPPDSPANDLKGLIAYARAKPDEVTCGSAGVGTILQLDCVLFAKRNNITIRHIPYRGAAEAINDLVGGHISSMIAATPFSQAKGGKLKLIAVLDRERHPDFPNVPTAAEQGFPNMGTQAWFLLLAPKGTPRPIIDRVNAEMAKVPPVPEIQARVLGVGFRLESMTPDQLHATLTQEWKDLGASLKEADVTLD